MTEERFYGGAYRTLRAAERYLLDLIKNYPGHSERSPSIQPIISCRSRIKSADSMTAKLKRQGLRVDARTALTQVYDAVGVRVICGFSDDVYRVADWLRARPELEVLRTKDYIAYPKPNGYRSYHMQVRLAGGAAAGTLAEVQIRTMAIDFWATLEHQLKYKREIPHEALIRQELKRCADEIAATDLSMQTIRDMLEESGPSERAAGDGALQEGA